MKRSSKLSIEDLAVRQLRAQIGSNMLPTIDAGGQAARQRALAIPEIGPNTFLYNTFVGQLQAHGQRADGN